MSKEPIYSRCGKCIGWKNEKDVLIWENTKTPTIDKLQQTPKPKRKSRLDEDKCVSRLIFKEFR